MQNVARLSLALGVLSVLTLNAPAARADDKIRLAVGNRGAWDTSVSELAQRSGIFHKHGIDADILYTDGGGETLQTVISASVDIGAAAGIMGALGAFSKGAPIRIVGAETTGARDLYWYVRSDSPITSLKNTAGKTLAYSTSGSSTNGVVLAFMDQYHLTAKPTATGAPPATLTQVMSGQIDVGWASPPFALEQADKKQIRIIASGNDAAVFKGQTVRVLVTHARFLQAHKELLDRYMLAYRETIDWMYADPAAIKMYADFNKISEPMAKRVRDTFFPKAAIDPDKVVGIDLVMPDAVKLKYVAAPLTAAQISQLIQIPPRN